MTWYDYLLPDCQACSRKSWRLFCDSCFKRYQFRGLCPYCAEMGSSFPRAIHRCQGRESLLEDLKVSFFYDEGVANWIKRLKARPTYRPWRELTTSYLPEGLDGGRFDAIAYVPSSRDRLFNPSRELAFHLSRLFENKPVLDLFYRKKFLKSQHQMNLKDRRLMVSKIFSLKQVPELRRLLLVDDVMTSGASLFACTRLIKSSVPGCQIEAFVVARQKKLL